LGGEEDQPKSQAMAGREWVPRNFTTDYTDFLDYTDSRMDFNAHHLPEASSDILPIRVIQKIRVIRGKKKPLAV
jgi:hypothetical protein